MSNSRRPHTPRNIVPDDAERAAWLVVNALAAVARAAARRRPELLADPRLGHDLERMCMRYLADEHDLPLRS